MPAHRKPLNGIWLWTASKCQFSSVSRPSQVLGVAKVNLNQVHRDNIMRHKGVRRVFVSASTRCFSDKSFNEACFQLDDLEYDKVELWLGATEGHLSLAEVVADPERFFNRYRETTRLAPIAFCLESDPSLAEFRAISRLSKQLRVTQITIPASKLGTPFNAEIDRLKALLEIGTQDGILLSIETRIGQLTEDPNTAVELCQATPGLGITLDPSCYTCGPHKHLSHDHVYPYVYHVHLRDSSATQFQVPIGLGEIDYSRVISQLRRMKYLRALSVELWPELMEVEGRGIELRKMRLLLESLL